MFGEIQIRTFAIMAAETRLSNLHGHLRGMRLTPKLSTSKGETAETLEQVAQEVNRLTQCMDELTVRTLQAVILSRLGFVEADEWIANLIHTVK